MTFRIDPALVKFNAAGTAQFEGDAKSARDLLQGLAISLKSGSGVKSGYLSLASASGGAGQVEVGLRRWRGANASTDQATTLVKELVSKAYGDQPAVQQALESYLQKSSNRIGTQSFARLVQSLSTEHSQVSGESQPAQSAQLNGLQVRRSARLDTEGFEASFKTRQTLDQASAGVKQAITSASAQADPVGALAALERQYEVLGRAIDQATSAGMNLDDLQESLRQLNAQMEQLHSRAAQVQALASDAKAELQRISQSALAPAIEARDSALRVMQEKAKALNQATATFYLTKPGADELESASQRHAQLANELQEAKALAHQACDELHGQSQALLTDLKQEWGASVAAQLKQGAVDPKRAFESALRDLEKQRTKDLEDARIQIGMCQDQLGQPDQTLAKHLSAGELPQAYQRLCELRGSGAAQGMAAIGRALHGADTNPTALAAFAAKAFGTDSANGLAIAQWMREAFDLQDGGAPAREQLMQALKELGTLKPDLARETVKALAMGGQRLSSLKGQLYAGAEFYLSRPSVGLNKMDLQKSVATIETQELRAAGATLAGSHLILKPAFINNAEFICELETSASLPAQIYIDFSSLKAKYESYDMAEAQHALLRAFIADSGVGTTHRRRAGGLLRTIERLPNSRPDLKTAMMRDMLQFFHDIGWSGPRVTWAAIVEELLRDPVYLADPAIRQLLEKGPLSLAWGESLLGQVLISRGPVEAMLAYVEQLPKRQMSELMDTQSEMFNQLFSFAEDLDDGDPLKQRINTLESRFLNSNLAKMQMQTLAITNVTYKDESDRRWKFEAGEKRRLLSNRDAGLYLSTPANNFKKILLSPDRLNWSDFQLLRYTADYELEFVTPEDMGKLMPTIREAFPLLQKAYETLPSDGASEVLGMIFDSEEADGLKLQLVDALRLTRNAPSPAELSVRLLPHLQPLMRYAEGSATAGPAGISREHYGQLLNHAVAHGFANDAESFARYLHCLSISFAFLSSDGGLGNAIESVESMRMYALGLHREAMHLSKVAPGAFKGHEERMAEVDAMFTNNDLCGHALAGNQATMMMKIDAKLAATMMPARLIGDNLAQHNLDQDSRARIKEEARNAAMARDLRGQMGDVEAPVRAPIQFGQDVLLEEADAGAMDGPDLNQPAFLDAEITARMGQLGDWVHKLGGSDPVTRLVAAAEVRATLSPIHSHLKAATTRSDAQLEQTLRRLSEQQSSIASERPPEGASQLEKIRFERDQKFRLGAIAEEMEATRANAQAMNDRHKAQIEAAMTLLKTSATILAEGPNQA